MSNESRIGVNPQDMTQRAKDIQIVETPLDLKAESVAILQEAKLDESRALIKSISDENAAAIERAARMVDPNWETPPPTPGIVGETPSSLKSGDAVYVKSEQRGNITSYINVGDSAAPVVTLDFNGAEGKIGEKLLTVKRMETSYTSSSSDAATIERRIQATDGRVFAETRTMKPDLKVTVFATGWFHDNVPAAEKPAWMNEDIWHLKALGLAPGGLETNLTINKTRKTITVMPSSDWDKDTYKYPPRESVAGSVGLAPRIVGLDGNYTLEFGEFKDKPPPSVRPPLPEGVMFK